MNLTNRITTSYILIFSVLFLPSLLLSCKTYTRNSTHSDVSLSSIRNGELLAQRYCQSCHMLPSPSLLDTKSWQKGVLPEMGPRLGVFQFGFEYYPSLKHDRFLTADFYPSQPLLKQDEWQDIFNYFVATSP